MGICTVCGHDATAPIPVDSALPRTITVSRPEQRRNGPGRSEEKKAA
jgi:hypothetical protein